MFLDLKPTMPDHNMEPNMSIHGSVVAFEGHPDIVSTQLRLLPTSPQVLILPSVQCYLPEDLEQAFEIRTYIKSVHEALVSRHDTAISFLRRATATNKRLVFLNGGTPTAQSLCIKAIMKHETGGDRLEAEAFFTQLVKDGLDGLDTNTQGHESVRYSGYPDDDELDDELQDPITRAMRAADALDRLTANLQPCDMLDLTQSTRPRSLSLPLYGYSDGFGDAAPFFLFGAHFDDTCDGNAEEDVSSADTPTFSVVDYNQPSKRTRLDSLDLPRPTSPSCIGESYTQRNMWVRRDTEILSPTSDIFSTRTKDPVMLGEAALLEMRMPVSISKAPTGRIKSLDRIYPLSAKLRDLCIPERSGESLSETPRRRPQSLMIMMDEKQPVARRFSHMEGPRTVIVTGKRPTIKIEPIPMEKRNKKKRGTIRASYVDRGTDASPPADAPFRPVLPCVEDLVVYFKDDSPDLLMASLLAGFKSGNYPVLSPSKTASLSDATLSSPVTPLYEQSSPNHESRPPIDQQSILYTAGDEYDPYAYGSSSWESSTSKQCIPTVNVVRPPTPAQTPPPYTVKDDKFHEFDITPGQTAVVIQNSLRSVLSVYFPPEAEGYRQFQFSLLPEFDGLWKPVFRESESRGSQQNSRRVDQILAIGSQQGVKKEYSSGIIKQLEKIGTKSSDARGRSGRVDFRYLLSNAMQTFTALPLANQTSDNPFTNSYLMATLIIPHLESYLALHSEIRYLLLEYPPEHLPTVLALQKLVGVDLIKVAQIVDSANKDALPFTQIGGRSVGTVGSKPESKTPTLSPQSSNPDITVSKANFLLTSTATDVDIAKFVSAVWNIETETSDSELSDWYFQDKVLRRKKNRPVPLNSTFTAFPRSSMSSQGGLSPTVAAFRSRSPSPALSSRRPSFMDNVKTLKLDGIKHGRSFSGRRFFRNDSASSPTVETSDSELDMEERRLMPLFMKPVERKSNTRKALKFLGLA